jgi:O-methyltransferase
MRSLLSRWRRSLRAGRPARSAAGQQPTAPARGPGTGTGSLRIDDVVAGISTEQIDHLVHALRLSGHLAKLSAEQVYNIQCALRAAGHGKDFPDTRRCTYNGSGLLTFFNADFLKDARFQEAYRLGQETDSWQGWEVEWRVYVACWAAAKGAILEGDYVECGVNRGGLSRAVMHYIDFKNLRGTRFYLLDTYCGIPEETRHLVPEYARDCYGECYAFVRETFQQFDHAVVIRGKVPDTLGYVESQKICYLSLDMNCAEPEIAAAEFFWDKLVSGAVVVLDDYGCGEWHLRQKEAFDRFARDRGVEVLSLPTGQGLLFKP